MIIISSVAGVDTVYVFLQHVPYKFYYVAILANIQNNKYSIYVAAVTMTSQRAKAIQIDYFIGID